jgi:hypothetical protein
MISPLPTVAIGTHSFLPNTNFIMKRHLGARYGAIFSLAARFKTRESRKRFEKLQIQVTAVTILTSGHRMEIKSSGRL